MTTELTMMGLITLVTLMASGGALFVSMRVSSSQKDFKLDLGKFELKLEHSLSEKFTNLEDKFMSKEDCTMYENMRKELESNYRGNTTDKLEGIEVQINKDRDDLTITLKSILTAIAAFREDSPRRGSRS
jgi:lipoate-protein ligase A